ncbi:Ribosomal RNA adenine dimethylase [Planctomycetes bacterium Pan216]|uniref:Ribosomal RNA small subunit methyltransferase A n=1 Tax=Kolteria novifilia TaxID=2527975 RepID=A0A518BAK7_9BACT|nr:Ribosomal RNA adenine dimethylase [Planctomycetes bacterium Pan216]
MTEEHEDRQETVSYPRPTRTYLKGLLDSFGLRPRRQYGQNFLIDLNLLELLARTAEIGPNDVVLEVGAGTGGLTNRLADLAREVVSVEIDPGFYELARKETRARPNLTLLHMDALKGKNRVQPEVLTALEEAMRRAEASSYKLVANLPYDVAASLVGNLLLERLEVDSMTMTVQLEVGERLVAEPGSKDYGPLSALVASVGEGRIVRQMPPSAFWPRPKVTSAIVRIDVDAQRRSDLEELSAQHRFVRDLFTHRRKSLRAALISLPRYKPLKARMTDLLESVGVTGDGRAEQLSPAELVRIRHVLEKTLNSDV